LNTIFTIQCKISHIAKSMLETHVKAEGIVPSSAGFSWKYLRLESF